MSNVKLYYYSKIYYDNNIIDGINGIDTNGLKLLMINGDFIKDVNIIIENGRSLVPVRIVSEKLGAIVVWNEKAREVKITKDNIEILIDIDNDSMKVNNKLISSNIYTKMLNNRLYLPLRVIAENINCTVGYNTNLLESRNGSIPIIWIEDQFDSPTIKTKMETKAILQNFLLKEINSGYIASVIEERSKAGEDSTYKKLNNLIDSIDVIDGFGRFYFVETQAYYDGEYNTVKGAGDFIFIDKYYGTIFEIRYLTSTTGEWKIFSGDECEPLMSFFVG